MLRIKIFTYGSTRFAVEPLVKASNHPNPESNGSGRGVTTKASMKYHGHARGDPVPYIPDIYIPVQ